ncbi:hypothetical protein B566_EDAN014144 [Ephemera danica]|nr:hypothetical protein B566_EDAN014144 [Ephemera danica]
MVFKILALVLFIAATVTDAAPQPSSSSATDVNRNDNCETQLAQCDRIAHDLRKQKVRAEAACLKLKFQLWRLGMQHTQLEDEIVILRNQIEHPNSGRGYSEMRRVREFEAQRTFSQVELLGNPNCTMRLDFCEWSQEQQRLALTNINADITNCTSRIEEQTRANNELIATKTSLKNQLVAQGMTPWDADNALENPSSAEYNIDDAEVEERAAASIVTPAPHSSH